MKMAMKTVRKTDLTAHGKASVRNILKSFRRKANLAVRQGREDIPVAPVVGWRFL